MREYKKENNPFLPFHRVVRGRALCVRKLQLATRNDGPWERASVCVKEYLAMCVLFVVMPMMARGTSGSLIVNVKLSNHQPRNWTIWIL